MERLQIFISGTQDDLRQERQAVAQAIDALGHVPLRAETYGAQSMPSYDAVREMIARADIYLGVYGARYGWKMPNGMSVTEYEFTEFRRTRPSRILIYVKDCTPEPDQAAFLQRVQDFNTGYFRRPKFTNATELAEWVKADLAQLIARVVHDKLRGAPDPVLVQAYLAQLAANKPYVLWNEATYIDRTVVGANEGAKDFLPQREGERSCAPTPQPLYPRWAARYDPRAPKPEAKPLPLDDVLAREKKVVLLGEPGIGKTTALLHLAWETAQRAVKNPDDPAAPLCIPIYLELKYYEGGELEPLLARRVNEMLCPANLMLDPDAAARARILKQWLAQSDAHFFLLLDGLNEVRPEQHTAVRGALESLLRTPHRIVIACRERDYDDSLRHHATAFVLQGLQADEIRDYMSHRLGEPGAELFDAQIRRDEKMQTLAANPLMLWLISVVAAQDPQARLPANRGKLFHTFVTQMPHLRRSEGHSSRIPLDVVETALAKLGFEMQERGRVSATLGEVRDWQIPTAGKELEAVLAQAKDWRFLKADGTSGEPIEFLHQLFQEYFAAVQLNRDIQPASFDTVLGDRPFRDEWAETITMLAGICGQQEHSDAALKLITWLGAQVVEKQQGRFAFLVQRCWETSDAATNDQARAVVVDALIAALRDTNAWVRRKAAYALGEIRDVRAVEPLIAALRDTDSNVRWRAAEALGKIGDARAVEPLIAALRDTNAWVRWSAAYALGKIGDARALPELERVAREDQGKTWLGSVADAARTAIARIREKT